MRQHLDSQDVHTLRLVVEAVQKGLLQSEAETIERIMAFLERPTPRDIDEIVHTKNLRSDETHAVEQTVNALWGAP